MADYQKNYNCDEATGIANQSTLVKDNLRSQILRICTCGVCADISYDGCDHLCCMQMSNKWFDKVEMLEQSNCLTESDAFKGCCNKYAVRGAIKNVFNVRTWVYPS